MICEGWETNMLSTVVAWIASRLWYGKEEARQNLEVSLNCWECKEAKVDQVLRAEYQEGESCTERALWRSAEEPLPVFS